MLKNVRGYLSDRTNRVYVASSMALTGFVAGTGFAGAAPLDDVETALEAQITAVSPIVVGIAVTVAGLGIALRVLRGGVSGIGRSASKIG